MYITHTMMTWYTLQLLLTQSLPVLLTATLLNILSPLCMCMFCINRKTVVPTRRFTLKLVGKNSSYSLDSIYPYNADGSCSSNIFIYKHFFNPKVHYPVSHIDPPMQRAANAV